MPQRRFHLAVAGTFLFFLVLSAPHRVHHFFEQFAPANDTRTDYQHEHSDGAQHSHGKQQDRPRSQQNDCVALSLAQHAHTSLVQLFSFSVPERAVVREWEHSVLAESAFSSAPCSQRAPPQV